MKWLRNLKIAQKLGLGFGLCLSLAALTGVVAISRMGEMNGATKLVVEDALGGVESVGNLADDMKQFRIEEFKHLLASDRTQKEKFELNLEKTTEAINQDIAECEKDASDQEERGAVSKIKELWKSYATDHETLLAISRKNDMKAGTDAMFKGAVGFNKVIDALDSLKKKNSTQGAALGKQAEGTYTSARSTVVTLLSIAILLGVLIATGITRFFVRVLSQVSDRLNTLNGACITNLRKATESLASGDVTAKIETKTTEIVFDSTDELGQMARNVNEIISGVKATVASFESAQESLSKLIAETKNASEGIATASSEVAAGNADLSQRTEEQAASLEETAASMEEMASTVKQTADNSKLANQLAAQARQVASDGGVVVRDAVTAMAAINEGSKRIAEIISVIDDIAFQTNLLALNAAVEAARVGEQGRGFAVVAAEVRNLAGRSATAAKEIKALVQDSVAKVQNGSTLVNESGERLDEIETAVKKVADVIAEISAASIEQSVGIDQVNKAVMQMDQVTQQNAGLVEEISASSQSTSQVAQNLQELISQFKIDSRHSLTLLRSEVKPTKYKATGTDGAPVGARRAPVKLTIAQKDDGFEDF